MWFKDHPFTSLLVFWVVNIALIELALQWINPSIFEFTYELQQVHQYSHAWKAELAPNRVAHIKLVAPDGYLLYNFLFSTSPEGFRTYDRQIDGNAALSNAAFPGCNCDRVANRQLQQSSLATICRNICIQFNFNRVYSWDGFNSFPGLIFNLGAQWTGRRCQHHSETNFITIDVHIPDHVQAHQIFV